MTQRDLDITLLGATGFVGRLIAEHLVATAPKDVRLAFAARDADRLVALKRKIGPAADRVETVRLDVRDTAALTEIVGRSKVIATTVGPYQGSGMPLVRACAEAGTHYADLSGEVLFVRQSIDECHEQARESGARIVHACGFDSVPSDLGVMVTAAAAAADGEGTLTDTTLYVRVLRGGISGGTIASARGQAVAAARDPAARRILADRHALSSERANEPSPYPQEPSAVDRPTTLRQRIARANPVRRDPVTGHWIGPFAMADFNTRIVRRSNSLTRWSYGRTFRYREVVDYGTSARAPILAGGTTLGLLGLLTGLSHRPTRFLLDRFLPKPGEGPSEATMTAGRFVLDIHTRTSTGASYRTRVGAELDPGYRGTAVMIGQAALALALDDNLPGGGGVLTPATGIGTALVDRLTEQGFTVDTRRYT